MIIDGKTYSWESTEIDIDFSATGIEAIEASAPTPAAPLLLTITLPKRLEGIQVEFKAVYE